MRVAIDARKIGDFGIGTYIRGLLAGLVALDSGDELMALAPQKAATSIPAGVEHVVVDAPHYSVRELVVLGRAAERASADVFHAPHYVVPFTRVPLVVTIHDLIHLHQPLRNPLAPLYARAMLRRAIRRARCVLTVTETVKAQLQKELGARLVLVSPNGVQLPAHEERSTEGESSMSTFLYVGNDKPHKNVERLVDAFAQVRRERPAAQLVLAGGGFARFRSRDGVEVRGFVSESELSSLYRRATAVVIPSIEEGFGLPAVEAMAHGAAVITSLDPALLEVTGDAALHVHAGDTRALAAAMLRVSDDARLRAALGMKGLSRVGFFTWKRCAEVTRQAYSIAVR